MESAPPPLVNVAAPAFALLLPDPDSDGSPVPEDFFFFAMASGATAMVNANTRNRAQPFSRLMDGPHKVAPVRGEMDGQMMECVQFEIVFAYLTTPFRITKRRVLTHGVPESSSGEQGMIVADRLENRAILGRAICCVKREPSAAALSNVAD